MPKSFTSLSSDLPSTVHDTQEELGWVQTADPLRGPASIAGFICQVHVLVTPTSKIGFKCLLNEKGQKTNSCPPLIITLS